MLCKNCKYWDKEDHICNKSEWLDVGQYATLEGDKFGIYAEAADDHDLNAEFKTGPDFGCIHFAE